MACGHLPFEDIPNAEEAGGPDAGPLVDGALTDGNEGGADGRVDAADAGCSGPDCIGTFVSVATGADTNPGTSARPVKTIAKATAIAVALGGGQNVYVAGGSYAEKVTLAQGVDLLGGYDCSAVSCTWARNPDKIDTAILAQDFEGVVAPSTVTRKTRFDGFRVVGKEGTAVAATNSVAMSLVGGTPIVSHCRFVGANVLGVVKSIGLAVYGPSNDPTGALIENNAIGSGSSLKQSAALLLAATPGGAPGAPGPVAVVTANRIRSGDAPLTSGVLAFSSSTGTVLMSNDISSGTATGGSSWGIIVESTMTIDANRINAEPTAVGVCTTPANPCGGIHSRGSTTTIVNNVILGGKGPRTCAVFLEDGEAGVGKVILNANTLDGAGNAGVDSTISTAIALRINAGNAATIGEIRNNILLGGLNGMRYGVYEDGTAGKIVRPVALANNGFWNAGTPRSDFAYRKWDGNVGTDILFGALATIGMPTPSANLGVDPKLDSTYHLTQLSPMIDMGTLTQAPPRDIDGSNRPKGAGIDIGADEAK